MLLLITMVASPGLEVRVNSQPVSSVVVLFLVLVASHGVPPVRNIITFHFELCTLPARARHARVRQLARQSSRRHEVNLGALEELHVSLDSTSVQNLYIDRPCDDASPRLMIESSMLRLLFFA